MTNLTFAFPQPWDAATESPSQELKDERTLDMKVDFLRNSSLNEVLPHPDSVEGGGEVG